MMLMLLLTELVHQEVRLFVEAESLRVQAHAGGLTDELRQAMVANKADILRFARNPSVETTDGLGTLTGHTQKQDITWVAPQRLEAWCYKIGVLNLSDGVERFYWPGMVSLALPNEQVVE
jgi:TubC N-terminal docking domain